MSSVCANCWERASRKGLKCFLVWVWKCIYFTFAWIVEELEKMVLSVCLFIPLLYVPLLTQVTISFKLCLFTFSASIFYDWSDVQISRDMRVLMQGSSSMWEILHIHSSGSFFPGQLLLPWFCRTCGVVRGARKQQTRDRANPVTLVCFLDRKRICILINGWWRTVENEWEQKNMTPYEFAVDHYRLRSSMFGKVEAGGKELNWDVCWG